MAVILDSQTGQWYGLDTAGKPVSPVTEYGQSWYLQVPEICQQLRTYRETGTCKKHVVASEAVTFSSHTVAELTQFCAVCCATTTAVARQTDSRWGRGLWPVPWR